MAKEVSKMKNGRAPGTGNVPIELLKAALSLYTMMSKLFADASATQQYLGNGRRPI